MIDYLEDSEAARRGQERVDAGQKVRELMREAWLAYADFMTRFDEPSDERWEIENAAKGFWEI